MATKKLVLKEFSVSHKMTIEFSKSIKAESFEQAIEKAKSLQTKDYFKTNDGVDVIDSSESKLMGVYQNY